MKWMRKRVALLTLAIVLKIALLFVFFFVFFGDDDDDNDSVQMASSSEVLCECIELSSICMDKQPSLWIVSCLGYLLYAPSD